MWKRSLHKQSMECFGAWNRACGRPLRNTRVFEECKNKNKQKSIQFEYHFLEQCKKWMVHRYFPPFEDPFIAFCSRMTSKRKKFVKNRCERKEEKICLHVDDEWTRTERDIQTRIYRNRFNFKLKFGSACGWFSTFIGILRFFLFQMCVKEPFF